MSDMDTLKDAYEAFGRGDVPAVLEAFDENITWHAPEGLPWGGTHRGPNSVAENVFGPTMELVDEFELNPKQFLQDGDTIVVVGTITGKVKHTGRAVSVRYAHVWGMRDGKAHTLNDCSDSLVWARALDDDLGDRPLGYPRGG